MNIDQVQEKIDLTPAQKKAWTQLVRAINKCKKENVFFYQVLETLGGLNGNNVRSIENIEYTAHQYGGPRDLNELFFPTVRTVCSFADDTHVVVLNDD